MTMTVSREDIDTEIIQDFPKETRFIKLDIVRYLELLGISAIRPQIAFINAVNNPKYRFVVGALSRRTGKTFIANVIAQLTALVPNRNILIMSPNYNLSEVSFREQRNLIKRFSIEVEKDNAKDRILELCNGSTIRMGSVTQVDSCVGRSYDLILFDEAALHDAGEEAFQIALRPTLDRPGSKAMFISTPRGKNNWFSKFYNRGYTEDFSQWASIWSDFRENNRMGDSDVEEARKSMSFAQFKQEYEASFISFEGQIFNFDSGNIIFEEDIPPDLEYIAGIDVGFRDPTAVIVIGYHMETGIYYAVEEYLHAERTSSQHAEDIKPLLEKYDVMTTYIDAAAAQTRYDWAYEHDIATVAANKSLLDGIACVQNIVEHNRLKVLSSCRNLLETLDQYCWDQGNANLVKERPKHDHYSHMADALRYALYSYSAAFAVV